jgi:hypothetical protein
VIVTMAVLDPPLRPPTPAASAEEAAAIAAAIERFTHDTAPAVVGRGEVLDGWTRAAMLEGVMRDRSGIGGTATDPTVQAVCPGGHVDVPHPWINP